MRSSPFPGSIIHTVITAPGRAGFNHALERLGVPTVMITRLHGQPSPSSAWVQRERAVADFGEPGRSFEAWPDLSNGDLPPWLIPPKTGHKYPQPPSVQELEAAGLLPSGTVRQKPSPKAFRFVQAYALIRQLHPEGATVLDVGGGQGILSYHLNQTPAFRAVVMDPEPRSLPPRFRVPGQRKLAAVPDDAKVPAFAAPYSHEIGREFDLLVGMHAHGANRQMVDTVAAHGNACLLFLCCVQGETPPPVGEEWFRWLFRYAKDKGLDVRIAHLPFKGRNLGLYVTRPEPSPRGVAGALE